MSGRRNLRRQVRQTLLAHQWRAMSSEAAKSRSPLPSASFVAEVHTNTYIPDRPDRREPQQDRLVPLELDLDKAKVGRSSANMLEAVYIFDQAGRVLLNFPVKDAPSIASVVHLATAGAQGDLDRDVVELSSSQLAYRYAYRRTVFLVPFDSKAAPLLVASAVDKLISAIEEYLGERITAPLLENNSASVVLLVDQFLDHGFPSITEPDVLKAIVQKNNILDKLLSAMGPAQSQALAPWEYPWRRPNVKYSSDELFVDVVEHLTLLVSASKRSRKPGKRLAAAGSAFYSTDSVVAVKPTVCRVRGEINVMCKLSGVPQVQLDLDIPGVAKASLSPSFHRAVDQSLWNTQRLISFVPPDGRTTIAGYVLDIQDQGLVYAELRKNLGDEKNEFEVRVSTNMDTAVKFVNNLSVTVVFPTGTQTFKELRNTSGTLDSSHSSKAVWTFADKTPVGWNATLRAQIAGASGALQPTYVSVSYDLMGRLPSRAAIKTVGIVNWRDNPKSKPFKGLRYQAVTDSFIVR